MVYDTILGGVVRPEDELLLCCARTHIDAARAERIRALLQHNLDWAYLHQAAYAHMMRPLLYWHLRITCPEAVPKTAMDYLQESFQQNLRYNRHLTKKLSKI